MDMSEKEEVCMVGTLYPERNFNLITAQSKAKSASSPIFMQEMIYKSLAEQEIRLSAYGYPPVAAYPNSHFFGTFGKRLNIGECGYVKIIPMINIIGIKQITVFISMFISLMGWAVKHRNKQKSIITYADFIEYTLPAILISKLFRCKIALFLTELPGYAHYKSGRLSLKDKIMIWMEKAKSSLYRQYDGYIFVSKESAQAVPCANKPWVVVEGFADAGLFKNILFKKKNSRKTAMYAGSLGPAYNIETLIDAFMKVKGDYELWLYGIGKSYTYAMNRAKEDPRIRCFGKVEREEVLKAEKMAHILLHVKSDLDEHSKYNFSSKLIEYMLSGTPVLTTCVSGVSQEYYDHAFVINCNTTEGIIKALQDTLQISEEDLNEKGLEAERFILSCKCSDNQGNKMLNLIYEMHEQSR